VPKVNDVCAVDSVQDDRWHKNKKPRITKTLFGDSQNTMRPQLSDMMLTRVQVLYYYCNRNLLLEKSLFFLSRNAATRA
jgi:hypothetical protein